MDETLKTLERRGLDRTESLRETQRPQSKPKEGPSTFDELLEQSRRMGQNLAEQKPQTRTVVREAVAHAEKAKEREREKSKDSDKEEEGKRETRSEKREGGEGEKRVVGKGGLKRESGSSGEGKGQGGMTGRKGTSSPQTVKRSHLGKEGVSVGSHLFTKELQAKLAAQQTKLPAAIPASVLDQVVRAVRLYRRRDGLHTLEIDCPEKLFQGLTLRFHAKDGKVAIEFLTANAETRRLFQKEEASLQRFLQSKGVAVATIAVR